MRVSSRESFPSGLQESVYKAEITMRLSEFEFPPMQDVLLVGRKAPIGPEAAKRMVDALSPEQYEIVRTDHQLFEAVVVRRTLLKQIPREKLLSIILEEGGRIATENMVVKAQLGIVIQVGRTVDL